MYLYIEYNIIVLQIQLHHWHRLRPKTLWFSKVIKKLSEIKEH